jgi:NAD(P)-dependent dehydrogenase (short-subunit alcohol dehydrogenase family)
MNDGSATVAEGRYTVARRNVGPFEAGDSAWLARIRPDRWFSLAGRVAVVTGGAGGIGRWLSAGFGLAGASVLVTDRESGLTEEAVAWLRDSGVTARGLAVDLEDDDAAARIVQSTLHIWGRLDVLVNSAGINKRISMLAVSPELLEHIWKIDYIRCYELSQAAARVMIDQGGGAIIQIGSLNSQVGLEDVSMLGPTKAALSQLAKVMTIEFARFGVRTNVLAPGFMATPMNASHWTHETRASWIFDRTPMSRPGHPAELVGTALLLASDAGTFISGQTIYVDGGFLAGSRWNVPPGTGLAEYWAWLRSGCPVGLPPITPSSTQVDASEPSPSEPDLGRADIADPR